MRVRDGHPSIHTINSSFIFIPTTTNGFLVHAMVDTGSIHTLTTRSLLKTFPHSPLQKTSTTNAMLGDADAPIAVHGLVHLCVYVNHIPTYVSAFVADSLSAELILGMSWCSMITSSLTYVDKNFLFIIFNMGTPLLGFKTILPFLLV